MGIKPGDEVIIPANTLIATAWGATLCGAKPVFVDCDPESYNIDPTKIEAAITPRTKAIVAVHLYGQPADMDPLREIAKAKNFHLVEDCAQSHLAEYKGKKVGGLSEAASFSFYPGKILVPMVKQVQSVPMMIILLIISLNSENTDNRRNIIIRLMVITTEWKVFRGQCLV